METQRLSQQPEDAPERPTQRLPDSTRRCLACQGVMTPLRFWTSAADLGWGDLRFGPRHPNDVPVPTMSMPPSEPYWDPGSGRSMGGFVFSLDPAPGPVDVAPEVKVETFA